MSAHARLAVAAFTLFLALGCASVRRAPQRATVTLKDGTRHVLDDAGFETPSLIPDVRRRYRLVVERDEGEPAHGGLPRTTPAGAGARGLPFNYRYQSTFDVDRLARLDVGEPWKGFVPVTLVFKNGHDLDGFATSRTLLGGDVGFGTRRILLEHVKSVAFAPQVD